MHRTPDNQLLDGDGRHSPETFGGPPEALVGSGVTRVRHGAAWEHDVLSGVTLGNQCRGPLVETGSESFDAEHVLTTLECNYEN